MISVIIPTVEGRESYLDSAMRSLVLHRAQEHEYEWLIYRDLDSCSVAWNRGAEVAKGDYILFLADDIDAHEGWAEAGMEWIDNGFLPAARILNSDGSLQSCGSDADEHETGEPSNVARIPFCSREQMECIFPVMPNHYMGDYHFTVLGERCGYQCVVVRDFLFTHHMASQGRIDTLWADVEEFNRRIA